MDSYQKIAGELRAFFSGHSIFKILLPIDMVVVYVCVAVMVLYNFISLGTLIYVIAYYGFFIGLLLAFANQNNKYLYTSLFIYAASEAYQVIKYAILRRFGFFDVHSLVTLLIFGFIAYLIFKYDSSTSKVNIQS